MLILIKYPPQVLESTESQNLPVVDFRIRLKLPGKTDNVVLEQFNLRALVNSEQDGFGNNWDYEQFNSGSAYGNSPSVFQQQGTKGTFTIGSNSFDLQHGYPNFFLFRYWMMIM